MLRRLRGFTLIELLVVISIITVLAALLFPLFSQVRARTRQTVCGSHLAQIARAGLLYLADYDERFPTCYPTGAPPYVIDWPVLLQPYVRNWDVFYCPERRRVMAGCLDPADGYRSGARCIGYGYNRGSGLGWGKGYMKGDGLARPQADSPGVVIGVTMADVVNASHCFFFGDTNDYGLMTLLRDIMPGVRKGGQPEAQTNELGWPYEPPRHRNGNNFAFVDGHIQWLRFHGGQWIDGGPWVVPDMSMYSHTGRWEILPAL